MSNNINAPTGLLENAPIATRIDADDPGQFGVPALQRGGPSLTGLAPVWAGWFNKLRQWLFLNISTVINNSGTFVSADPIANGAAGDGVTDDTVAIQQTITATGGILYLRPGATFLISSSITVSSLTSVVIYGEGSIKPNMSAGTAAIALSSCSNIYLLDLSFNGTNGADLIHITGGGTAFIESCNFTSTSGSTGIVLTSVGSGGVMISNCFFNVTTGISIISNTSDILISGSYFFSAVTTPVSTTTPGTYSIRGCNIFDYYAPPIARATAYQNSVGTSLANNAFTALLFDTNTTDSNSSIHSTSTNTSRFTAPVAGNYLLQAQIQALGTGLIGIEVRKNGSTTNLPHTIESIVTNSASGVAAQLNGRVQLAASDYIEYLGFQNSGAAITTVTSVTWGGMYLMSQP